MEFGEIMENGGNCTILIKKLTLPILAMCSSGKYRNYWQLNTVSIIITEVIWTFIGVVHKVTSCTNLSRRSLTICRQRFIVKEKVSLGMCEVTRICVRKVQIYFFGFLYMKCMHFFGYEIVKSYWKWEGQAYALGGYARSCSVNQAFALYFNTNSWCQ